MLFKLEMARLVLFGLNQLNPAQRPTFHWESGIELEGLPTKNEDGSYYYKNRTTTRLFDFTTALCRLTPGTPFRAMTGLLWYLTAFLTSTSAFRGSNVQGVGGQYFLGLGEFPMHVYIDCRA
jgi:hypothetical protein